MNILSLDKWPYILHQVKNVQRSLFEYIIYMQGNIESVLLALYRLMLFIEKKEIREFAIVSP